MPVVPEGQRLDVLRQLGLSQALISLSAGKRLHRLLEFSCAGPPFYSYHEADCPDGPPLAPLWDCGDVVTAVWVRDGRTEFIDFDIEAASDYRVLAYSEQGLWASVFMNLPWNRSTPQERRAAADAVGFRFLERLATARESGERSKYDDRETFLRTLISEIDGRAGAT